MRVGIPSADFERGITVIFAAAAFPGSQFHVKRVRKDWGGDIYYSPDFRSEGWLCPALLLYFDTAPDEIHFQIKPLK